MYAIYRTIYLSLIKHMHNIRKIKKKKKSTKPVNSEELAQQKLFQISRFQQEEPVFNEADIFAQKLGPKASKRQHSSSHKHRFIKQNNSLTQFVDNLQKNIKISNTFTSFKELRSQSSEIQTRRPISIIHYMLIDKRKDRDTGQIKRRLDSLIGIKRKFSPIRNRSHSPYSHQLLDMLNPQERVAAFMAGSNENASPIKMKNAKLFNKSSGFSGR